MRQLVSGFASYYRDLLVAASITCNLRNIVPTQIVRLPPSVPVSMVLAIGLAESIARRVGQGTHFSGQTWAVATRYWCTFAIEMDMP